MFDLCDTIVLRPFGTPNYIFVQYDCNVITKLEELKSKIEWKHLDCIDDSLKNDKLLEEKGQFRNHLQLSYQHKKILKNDKLVKILP